MGANVKPPPPPPPPPDLASQEIIEARKRERKRLQAASNLGGTILTSPAGLQGQPKLGVPTMLGGSS